MSLIRNIVVKVGADISGLSSGMSKAQASMKENVNKMVDAAKTLVLAGTASFTALAIAGVQSASAFNETQNVINTTFGNSATQVDAWAKSAVNAYGLNEESALKYAGTMGAMFKGMGVSSAQAQQMSESITGLSGDMASFYNMSTDDAFSKLQAGIAGQTKPLRDLGINMSTANLQAFALSEGITTAYKSMSQGEQTTLRYNYLMNASSLSQGDFVKTSGTYANQMRVFQANVESLTTSLGQAVIPIIQAVLPWINMFAQALIGAATTFTKWIDGMLGIKAQAVSTAVSSNTLADSQNNLATGINNVAAAATAANKAVSGIDELNILQKSSSTGGIGSAATIPVTGDSGLDTSGGTPTPNVSNLGVKIIGEAQLEAFKKAMGDAWNWIGKFHDGIISVASVIGVFFLPAIAKSIIELGTESVGAFTKGIAAVIQYGAAGWESLASTEANIEAWIVEKAQLVEDISFKVEDKIATLASAAASKVAAAAQYVMSGALWESVSAWVAGKAELVENTAQTIAHTIATDAAVVAQKAAAAGQWLLNAAMDANPLGLIIVGVAALIAVFVLLWNNNKNFRDFFITCWAGIKKTWDGFVDGISSAWHNTLAPFGTFIWDLFVTKFNNISSTVKTIIGDIKEVFTGLTTFFSGVFTGNWSKAFQGLQDIASGIFGGIEAIIKAPLNSLISSINLVLSGINGLAKSVSNVPGLSWLKGVNIPQLPKLAEGGIISKPTVAMIGEAGTEAVVPLKNTGFVESLAAAVASAVQGGNKAGSNGDINITMQIDGNVFGKLCVKAINGQTRKLGVNPLYI